MQLVISTLFLSILMKLLLTFVQKCTKETGILKEFCERSSQKQKISILKESRFSIG